MEVKKDVNLAPFTTLGVGGPARYFVEAASLEEVQEALRHAKSKKLPVFVLGGGSNLLVSDKGYNGLVLKVDVKEMELIGENKDKVFLRVGAGEVWDEFVKYCIKRGYYGVECLSGIPGLVGASPVQNIGAYGQEVKDIIVKVETVSRESFNTKEFNNLECEFSYRNSIFKQNKDSIITHVTFEFSKKPGPGYTYEALKKLFSGLRPDLKEVRDKVLEIRKEKSMVYDKDDVNSRSTGSFFVNPEVNQKKLHNLLKKYPKMPYWKITNSKYKLAAAWLIEKTGFHKGYEYKTAALSEKHTLAMINKGEAKASHIFEFSQLIREKVLEDFRVELELEAVLVGDFSF